MSAYAVVGPTKRKPAPLERLGERGRLGRDRRHVGQRARRRARAGSGANDQISAAEVVDRRRGAGVGDRRLDLGAVAHDARVAQQPLDVGRPELGHGGDREARERGRGTPRACAGSSATTGRTGTPRGTAARTARRRRAPAGPTPRRGSAGTRRELAPQRQRGAPVGDRGRGRADIDSHAIRAAAPRTRARARSSSRAPMAARTRPQPRAGARARDRGRRAGQRALDRPRRQGGGRPGGRRRHARRAAHDPHGRHRRDRRGREGRGADAPQRRGRSATARRPRSTSPSTRSRARACARWGMPSAIAVIALAERGTMFDPGPFVYMEKMAAGERFADLLDLDRPLGRDRRADRRAQGHRRQRRDGGRARPPAPRGGHRGHPRGRRARAADHRRRRVGRAATPSRRTARPTSCGGSAARPRA